MLFDTDLGNRERFIIGVAIAHFGLEPVDVQALKPSPFTSLRLTFKDRTVIATQRKNFRRTHLEAIVLEQLSKSCDDVPSYYGMLDGVMFQSDLGDNQLVRLVHEVDSEDYLDLAAEACASIFRIQNAARQCSLTHSLPVYRRQS